MFLLLNSLSLCVSSLPVFSFSLSQMPTPFLSYIFLILLLLSFPSVLSLFLFSHLFFPKSLLLSFPQPLFFYYSFLFALSLNFAYLSFLLLICSIFSFLFLLSIPSVFPPYIRILCFLVAYSFPFPPLFISTSLSFRHSSFPAFSFLSWISALSFLSSPFSYCFFLLIFPLFLFVIFTFSYIAYFFFTSSFLFILLLPLSFFS